MRGTLVRAFVATFLRALRLRTRPRIARFHDRAARRLLAAVLPHSAHTRARLAAHPDWRTLPPIDKAEMMAQFDALVTVPVSREAALEVALRAEATRDFAPLIDGLTVGLSTGTSGQRGLFLVSPAERAAWAGIILAKLLPDALVGRHRIAFFLRANSALYESLGARRIQFRYFDLERPLAALADELAAFSPTAIVAPPTVLRALAERVALRPRRVVSVAEVLDPLDEVVIRGGFGLPVEQVYQATEGLLGATCRRGALHLAEDVNHFELVPLGEGRFTPIVTNLFRTTQPIVRYRLDDVLALRPSPCPCGSPFVALDAIEGRVGDVVWGAGPHGPVPIFSDLLARAIARAVDVESYEVVHDDSGLEVALRIDGRGPSPEERARVSAEVTAVFARQGARPPTLTFRAGASPNELGRIKQRRVRRRSEAP